MIESSEDRIMLKTGAVSAGLAVFFIAASMMSVSFVPIIPGKVAVTLQAQLVASQPWRWILPFLMGALGYLVMLPVVLSIDALFKAKHPVLARLGAVHGAIGVVLLLVSAFMHATVVRRAATEMVKYGFENYEERTKGAHLAQAIEWNMLYPSSSSYAFAVLGQSFLSVLFVCIAIAWIRERGLKRAVAVLSVAVAVMQIAGLAGYLSMITWLEAGNILFDLVLPFILLFLAIIFVRESRKREIP